MLLLKIEPSEITPFFYNNFFDLGGGDVPCVPTLAAPMNNTRFRLKIKVLNCIRLFAIWSNLRKILQS